MQIQEVDVAQVLDLDPGVPGDVKVLEALRHHPDHPGQDPPGEDAGAGRGVPALRVEAGHHARGPKLWLITRQLLKLMQIIEFIRNPMSNEQVLNYI